MASVSISTNNAGSINRLTSTSVAAGRICPNTSACTLPSVAATAMSVTNIRVRTTSSRHEPASVKAAATISKMRLA